MKILVVLPRYQYGETTRGETHEYSNFVQAIKGTTGEVDFIDTSAYIKTRDIYELNVLLLDVQSTKKYEIIFFVQWGNEVFSETLEILKETGALLINWATDDSYRFESFTRLIAKRFDYIITTEFAAVRKYEKITAKCIKASWGYSEEWKRLPKPASDCLYDVSFIGMNYFDRYEYIKFLKKNGINIFVAGYGWPRSNGIVQKEDIPSIYNNSRIVLNFSKSKNGRQTKARVFESLAAGTCLLSERSEDLDSYFEEHKHLITFDSKQECLIAITRLLSDPFTRDEIAMNGHAHCVARYSYERQFEDILRKVYIKKKISSINKRKFSIFREKIASAPFALRIIRRLLHSKWIPSIIRRIVRKIEEKYFKETHLSMNSFFVK